MKALLAITAALVLLLVIGCQGKDAQPASADKSADEKQLWWPASEQGTKPMYGLPLVIEIDVPEVPREIAEPAAKLEAEEKAKHPAEASK